MDFRDLPADAEFPVAQRVQQVPQGGGELVGRLIEDEGAGLGLQELELHAPFLLVDFQEAFEGEAAGVHAGEGQRRREGRGAGDGVDRDAVLEAQVDEVLPRVRDGRHAGVGDQRAVLALQDACEELRTLLVLIVLMVAHHGCLDVEVVQQFQGDPGVLGRDEVGGLQCLDGPGREVREVPDGGPGHEQCSTGVVSHFGTLPGCIIIRRSRTRPRSA